MPWSTRAVIFLAFAIQLGPLSERLAPSPIRPADCLTLCDGRLLAILYNTADADRQASLAAATALVRTPGFVPGPVSPVRPIVPRPGLDQVGGAILPMPPPAAC